MNVNKKQLLLDEDTLANLRCIRTERKRLGLSQRELAAMLKIGADRISVYENGKEHPLLQTYIQLAQLFDWDIENNPNYLFYHHHRSQIRRLNILKDKHSYSYSELGEETNLSKDSVYRLLNQFKDISIASFVSVMQVLKDEDKRAKNRKKLFRRF